MLLYVKKIRTGLCALAFGISTTACMSTMVSSAPNATIKPSISDTTLGNGLRVIIKQDHRAPVVIAQIWYNVGSADESADETGLSHALEHMMFKGTDTVPGEEFARINAAYGGTNNAFTMTDVTSYYQIYPAQYLGLALELEADRMQHLVLKEADFNKEIKVVMEERRQRTDDNPKALAIEKFKQIAYPTSPLRYPVIGHMQSLEKLQVGALAEWYKQWYAPNNATLVIVGDVDPSTALPLVNKYFAQVPSKTLRPRVSTDEYQHFGERTLNVFSSVKVPMLYLGWNVPSLTTAKDRNDAYALALIVNILDGGRSARFEKKLVREQRLATAISSSYDLFARGGELFTISAIPDDGKNSLQVKNGILAEIEKLKTEPVLTKELERIQNNYLAELVYNQDSVNGQASLLGSMVSAGLSYTLIDTLPSQIKAITPAQIQDVAKRYLVNDNLSTLYVAPELKPASASTAKLSALSKQAPSKSAP